MISPSGAHRKTGIDFALSCRTREQGMRLVWHSSLGFQGSPAILNLLCGLASCLVMQAPIEYFSDLATTLLDKIKNKKGAHWVREAHSTASVDYHLQRREGVELPQPLLHQRPPAPWHGSHHTGSGMVPNSCSPLSKAGVWCGEVLCLLWSRF